jgi:hypothetical protein
LQGFDPKSHETEVAQLGHICFLLLQLTINANFICGQAGGIYRDGTSRSSLCQQQQQQQQRRQRRRRRRRREEYDDEEEEAMERPDER